VNFFQSYIAKFQCTIMVYY